MEIEVLSKRDFIHYVEDFCELSRKCFSANVDATIVRQRYLESPYDDLVVAVARNKGKTIGNCSAVSTMLEIGGEEHKAALLLNLMTLPEYEGRGVFSELMLEVCTQLTKQDVSVAYVFPNQLSNGILCNKLGWKDVAEIPTLELVLDQRKNWEIDGVEASVGKWNNLVDRCGAPIKVKKSSEYMSWRYEKNREKEYGIVRFLNDCWAVFHVYGRELNITEFHHDSQIEHIKEAVNYLLHMAKQMGMQKVTTWAPINSAEHLILERYGFLNKTPIRYFCAKALNYQGEMDIYDFRNWRIYMGDDNVY